MAYSPGTAILPVVPSMKGFHQQVRTELAKIKEEMTVKVIPDFDRTSFAKAPRVPDQTVKVKAEVDKKSFVDASNAAAMFTRNLAMPAVFVAAAAAVPTLLDFTNAALTASQSLLMLPAAGLAAATVLGTVKLATTGMGDAFKLALAADRDPAKYAEALGKLAPNARDVVTEVAGIKPAFDSMRLDVQNVAFRSMAGVVSDLAANYLPVLRTGLYGVADATNEAVVTTASWLNYGPTIADVGTIIGNVRDSMFELNAVGLDAVSILIDVGTVGSDFLPGLAHGFGAAADMAAEFVSHARETGQLRQWISDGLDALGLLGTTFLRVGQIIFGVLRAANTDSHGFLVTVVELLTRVRDFVNSASGQSQIGTLFTNLRGLASALLPLIGAVALSIYGLVQQLGPSLPGVATAITAVMTAAAPVTGLFGDLAVSILPALTDAITFLAPVLGPLVGMMLVASVASKAWAVATTAAELSQKALTIATTVGKAAMLAWQLITDQGTRQLVVWAAKQWLVNAAMSANPIGLIVIAIGLLVAGIVLAYTHSETFRAIVAGAWTAIKDAASAAWGFLRGVFAAIPGALDSIGQWFVRMGASAAQAWDDVVSAATVAWEWIVSAAQGAYGILQTIMGGISTAITAVGDAAVWLWQNAIVPAFDAIGFAAKLMFTIVATIVLVPLMLLWNEVSGLFMWGYTNLIKPAWQGITDAISTAWNSYILPILTAVVDWVQARLVHAFNFYRDAAVAAWEFVRAGVDAAWQWILANIWQPIIAFINGPLTSAWNAGRDVAVAAWNAIRDGVNAAWQWILANIWQPIIAFINGPLLTAWNAGRDAAVAAWVAIQNGINAAWQWILNNIWNPIVAFINSNLIPAFNTGRDGMVAAWNAVRDGINTAWQWILNNIWNPLITFITVTIPDGFNKGVAAITAAWTAIKKALRDPLQAAIDVVWNQGVVTVFNKVAELVALPTRLTPYTLPNFAEGGPVVGGSGVRDDVPLLAMGGEYVLDKRTVAKMGGTDQVAAMHRAMRGDHSPLHLDPAYLLYGGDPSSPGLAIGMAAGGSVDAALAFARAQNGKPYQWAGVGNPSYDCSGFQSAITNVLTGRAPNHRLFSTASFAGGRGAAGFVPGTGSQYVIGVRQGNPGHMAGVLAGVPVESNGSGVTVGRGKSPMSFPAQFYLPQVGGQFVNAGGDGGGPSIAELVATAWKAVTDAVTKLTGLVGDSPWGQAILAFGKKLVDESWKYVSSKIVGAITSTGVGTVGEGLANNPTATMGLADTGGMLYGQGVFAKAVAAPERVLSPGQNRSFEALAGTLSSRQSISRAGALTGVAEGLGAAGGDGAFIGSLTVPVPEGAGVQETLDAVFTRARHEQRRGRYGRPA